MSESKPSAKPRLRLLLGMVLGAIIVISIAAWRYLTPPPSIEAPEPGTVTEVEVPEDRWRSRLTDARRTCEVAPLQALLSELRAAAEMAPKDGPEGETAGELWDLVAASELELMLTHCIRLPWIVAKPLYDEVPDDVLAASDRGLAALQKARALGFASAEGYRVETALLSHRITGMGSALKYQPQVNKAFEKAQEIDPENPRLHVGLGCRKMFSPPFLGQDFPAALAHFEYAIARLPRDERPTLYAAMALHLLERPAEALAKAEQALAMNPAHPMAQAVVERMRAGDPDPFGKAANK